MKITSFISRMMLALVSVYLFFGITGSSIANPNLWDAIDAFERGDDKRAAQLFRPYIRATPIARPYVYRLKRFTPEGELDGLEPLSDCPFHQHVKRWYECSVLVREHNQKSNKMKGSVPRNQRKKLASRLSKIVKELKKLGHLGNYAALRLRENVLLNSPNVPALPDLLKLKAEYAIHAMACSYEKVFDLRVFSGLLRLKKLMKGWKLYRKGDWEFEESFFKSIGFKPVGEGSYLDFWGVFEDALNGKPVGAALREFQQKLPANIPVSAILQIEAAIHGNYDAQMCLLSTLGNTDMVEDEFYWLSVVSEWPITVSQRGMSHSAALFRFGRALASGLGCKPNWKKASSVFHRSIDPKLVVHPNAYLAVGRAYEEGTIVERNVLMALKLFLKALENPLEDTQELYTDHLHHLGKLLRTDSSLSSEEKQGIAKALERQVLMHHDMDALMFLVDGSVGRLENKKLLSFSLFMFKRTNHPRCLSVAAAILAQIAGLGQPELIEKYREMALTICLDYKRILQNPDSTHMQCLEPEGKVLIWYDGDYECRLGTLIARYNLAKEVGSTAEEILRISEKKGHPGASYELARLIKLGDSPNLEEAKRLLEVSKNKSAGYNFHLSDAAKLLAKGDEDSERKAVQLLKDAYNNSVFHRPFAGMQLAEMHCMKCGGLQPNTRAVDKYVMEGLRHSDLRGHALYLKGLVRLITAGSEGDNDWIKFLDEAINLNNPYACALNAFYLMEDSNSMSLENVDEQIRLFDIAKKHDPATYRSILYAESSHAYLLSYRSLSKHKEVRIYPVENPTEKKRYLQLVTCLYEEMLKELLNPSLAVDGPNVARESEVLDGLPQPKTVSAPVKPKPMPPEPEGVVVEASPIPDRVSQNVTSYVDDFVVAGSSCSVPSEEPESINSKLLDPKLLELQEKINQLGKTVKTHKFQAIMRQAVNLLGVEERNTRKGKGYRAGRLRLSYHPKHGKGSDPSVLRGGRLKSLKGFLSGAVSRKLEQGESEG